MVNNFKISYRVIRGLHFTSTPSNFPQKNLWLNSIKRAWMSGHGSSSSHSLDIMEDMSSNRWENRHICVIFVTLAIWRNYIKNVHRVR
jgi:hypothetical protein